MQRSLYAIPLHVNQKGREESCELFSEGFPREELSLIFPYRRTTKTRVISRLAERAEGPNNGSKARAILLASSRIRRVGHWCDRMAAWGPSARFRQPRDDTHLQLSKCSANYFAAHRLRRKKLARTARLMPAHFFRNKSGNSRPE